MNIPRAVVLGVVGGAMAAWLASASTSGPSPPPVAASVRSAAADKSGAALAAEIARLHDRLHPTAAPEQPARNLFEFRAAAPLAAPVERIAPEELSAPAPDPSPAASLTLIGIAEDGGVRTAIVSGSGQLSIAKEGELVAGRYTVVRVGPTMVELTDSGAPSGAPTIQLTLK